MKNHFQSFQCFGLIKSSLLLICISLVLNVTAQVNVESDKLFAKYTEVATKRSIMQQGYFIVRCPDIEALQKKGVWPIRLLSDEVGIFSVADSMMLALIKTNHFQYALANDKWKLSPQLEKEEETILRQRSSDKLFTLLVKNVDSFIATIKANKYEVDIKQVYKETNALLIACNPVNLFKEILPLTSVLFVDSYNSPQPDILLSGYYKTINLITSSEYFFPDANGQGITIGIKEKKMDEKDIDLQKRVLPSGLAFTENDMHATTIATLAGGAGNSFISGKGLASHCFFYSSNFNNLFPDSTALLQQNNVSIQNHSYGTQIQSFYGAEAMSYDLQTVQNKNLLHVFSSGNRGTDTPVTGIYEGLSGFANITGNFKMAKNVISIAAIDTSDQIAAYSSSGPLFDGRMAPQLAALGPNGTSEAAAIVSGAVAVLQQLYKETHGQQVPPASLIKSILFCTADDIGVQGIDYRSGFGAVNVLRAIECLENNNFDSSDLQQGESWIKTITIPPQATNLRITLTWTDTTGVVNSYKALSNDLDIELKEMATGTIFLPWCLSSFPQSDSLKKPSIRRRDTLNTAELISLDLPSAGNYEIKVNAAHIVTTSKQSFHIAYTLDSLASFRFVAPLQQSDFFLGNSEAQQIKIKWLSGAITPAETGTLSVTMNSGNSWQILEAAVSLAKHNFVWTVPDTNGVIQFRMNTSYGTFYSPKILLGKLTTLKTDYLCTDSFRLSWNNQPLAQSFQLYALGDSSFMKLIEQQTDTFIVMQRNAQSENVYAVRPILNSNIPAARSFAIDITRQSNACMYRSFYGIPVGDSIELSLQLDYPQGLDSVVIEKINSAGMFLSRVKNIILTFSQFSYTVYDDTPEAGANYYRAKIWFAGRFVFSEIINIIHPGRPWLFLYPNPVASGQPLYYTVREAPFDFYLQIYSLQGQLVTHYLIQSSGIIMTQKFWVGMYFYLLTNSKNEKLQVGKLIFK